MIPLGISVQEPTVIVGKYIRMDTAATSHKRDAIDNYPLTVVGRFKSASNATLLASLDYEKEKVFVVYKPTEGERPLWDFPSGTLANREVAAYRFSQAVGFGLVPYTTLRDGPFGLGSVQEFVDLDESINVVDFVESSPESLRTMAIFDAVVNNTDRKFAHILPSKEGVIYGCDHGVCFHEEPKLRTVLWNWESEPFTEDEMHILESSLGAIDSVREMLADSEVLALEERISRLLSVGCFPTPSELWPPVPWPLF